MTKRCGSHERSLAAMHGSALLLVVLANWSRSWSVLDLDPVNLDLTSVTLAPEGYCLRFTNGSSMCHSVDLLSAVRLQTNDSVSATDRLVASSWCNTAPSSALMRVAQSLACLVALEACLYSTVAWAAFSIAALLLALVQWLAQDRVYWLLDWSSVFFSGSGALLGVLTAIEWWIYATFFIESQPKAQSIALHWSFGASFYLVLLATAVCCATARLATHLSIGQASNYARLHVLPPQRRRRRSSSSAIDNCTEALDPLRCPANYLVQMPIRD